MRLDRSLKASACGDAVREVCEPYFQIDRRQGSRPGIDPEVYEKVLGLVLKALRDYQFLRGRELGIDASVMEANASMQSLGHRLTGEDYQKYVSGLAEEAGVDP